MDNSYRLPHDVRGRLTAALKPYRNRDACLVLASFIGRYWSAPRKLGLPFMLDRRALAAVEALGLSEARVRGAVQTLERIGFIGRAVTGGRTHQATADGLRRRPVAYLIAADYRSAFAQANARAQAARSRRLRDRQGAAPTVARRPSPALPQVRPACSPKWNSSEAAKVHLGEKWAAAPPSTELNLKLEAALDRWRRAFERERAVPAATIEFRVRR